MLSEDEKISLIAQGLELYKNQQYYLCHEVLEEVWREDEGDRRQLIQAIIQTAVACYHCLRGNRQGALTLSSRALTRLLRLPTQLTDQDSCSVFNIDLEKFRQDLNQFQEMLRQNDTNTDIVKNLPKIVITN